MECQAREPSSCHLPLEWANIRLLTRKKDWTEPQRRMMKRAGRVHGLRTLGLVILVSLITWGGIGGLWQATGFGSGGVAPDGWARQTFLPSSSNSRATAAGLILS